MGEGFKADPDHVAGYGLLLDESSGHMASIAGHVGNNAESDGEYTGLMSIIKTPVDTYAHKTSVRMFNRVDKLTYSAPELTRAAWVYSGADEKAYTEFDHTLPNQVTGYKDFPDPVAYPAADNPEAGLDAPDPEDADIRGLLDEVGGSINAIDDAVNWVTGWSPISALVEPMSGNWTRLERAGTVLGQAGDAAEKVSSNLTSGLSTLDPHWDGGAAQSFTDYLNRLSSAIGLEGPLNRIIGGVYQVVAEEIKKCAQWMCETLKKAVDKVAQAAASWWIPGAGWIKIIDAVKTGIEVFNAAKQMIEDLNTVIDQVNTVVEAAKDPVGFIEGKIDEQIEPIREKIDQVNAGLDVAGDLAALTDTEPWEKTPDEKYQTGEDEKRPGE